MATLASPASPASPDPHPHPNPTCRASEDADPGLEKKTKTDGIPAVNVVKKDKQAVSASPLPPHVLLIRHLRAPP